MPHNNVLRIIVGILIASIIAAAPLSVGREVAFYQNSSSHDLLGSFFLESTSNSSSRSSLWSSETAAAYNETFIGSFVHFSRVAYCQSQEIDQWSDDATSLTADSALAITGGASAERVVVVTNSTTDTQAYVAYFAEGSTGSVVVSFRGSQSMQNWITNLQFSKAKAYPHCSGCETHSGFLKAWESVLQPVTDAVKDMLTNHTGAALFVTGHSLGAALAVLCGAHLSLVETLPVTGVYTFGEPRVGNTKFAQFFQEGKFDSRRITHYKDPVPHLPMSSLGFTHVPTEVWYTEKSDEYRVCDSSGEDSTCSNSAAWDSLLFIDDHLTYIGLAITSC